MKIKFTSSIQIRSPVILLIASLKKSVLQNMNKDNDSLTSYWWRKETHTHTHMHTNTRTHTSTHQEFVLAYTSGNIIRVWFKLFLLLDNKSYLFFDLIVRSVFVALPRLWLDSGVLVPIRVDSQLRSYGLKIFP